MKAFLPSVLLLALLFTFSVLNCAVMVRETDRWSAGVRRADELARAEDWSGARSALKQSHKDWSRAQTYLHIVVRHEAVDSAESMYLQADAYASAQEEAEFRAETAELQNQLRLLAEMERINIKNIL